MAQLMVAGGASGLLRAPLRKGQFALLGPQNLRILRGPNRGRYRHPRIVALELFVWARGTSLGPGAWWQSWQCPPALLARRLAVSAFLPPGFRLAGLFGDGTQVSPGTFVAGDISAALLARHASVTICEMAGMRTHRIHCADDLRA
eukprot:3057179-Amphidinium_carterae.1